MINVRGNLLPSTVGSPDMEVSARPLTQSIPAANIDITIVGNEIVAEMGGYRHGRNGRNPSFHLILELDVRGLQLRRNGRIAIAHAMLRK